MALERARVWVGPSIARSMPCRPAVPASAEGAEAEAEARSETCRVSHAPRGAAAQRMRATARRCYVAVRSRARERGGMERPRCCLTVPNAGRRRAAFSRKKPRQAGGSATPVSSPACGGDRHLSG
jgi:hypothetical protein